MNAIRFALVTSAGLALCACSGAVDSPSAADAAALGDAATGDTDTADTETADAGYDGAVVHSCADLPGPGYIPINCDFEGACTLGQECCCGECYASTVCTCVAGTASCHATDACYHVTCGDAEPPPAP